MAAAEGVAGRPALRQVNCRDSRKRTVAWRLLLTTGLARLVHSHEGPESVRAGGRHAATAIIDSAALVTRPPARP
jgi:hypothetical protein